jgi:hypothetical protein
MSDPDEVIVSDTDWDDSLGQGCEDDPDPEDE